MFLVKVTHVTNNFPNTQGGTVLKLEKVLKTQGFWKNSSQEYFNNSRNRKVDYDCSAYPLLRCPKNTEKPIL